MDIAAVAAEIVGQNGSRFVGVAGRVHRRRRAGKGPTAVVDLEDTVAVAMIADHIVA